MAKYKQSRCKTAVVGDILETVHSCGAEGAKQIQLLTNANLSQPALLKSIEELEKANLVETVQSDSGKRHRITPLGASFKEDLAVMRSFIEQITFRRQLSEAIRVLEATKSAGNAGVSYAALLEKTLIGESALYAILSRLIELEQLKRSRAPGRNLVYAITDKGLQGLARLNEFNNKAVSVNLRL